MERKTLLTVAPAFLFVAVAAAIFLLAGMMRPRREPGAASAVGEEQAEPPRGAGTARAPLVEEMGEPSAPPPVAPREETAAEEEPPAPRVTWELADERRFSGRSPLKSHEPYYVIEAEELGRRDKREVIRWKADFNIPEVEYRPDEEFLLDSSWVADRRVRLSENTPHTVRWEVSFQPAGGAFAATVEPNGIVIGEDPEGRGLPLSPEAQHTAVIERAGEELKVTLDGRETRSVRVEADDRVPLQITAQVRPVLLRETRLFFGKGEKFSPPPAKAEKDRGPQWEAVYREDFSRAESINAFEAYPPAGLFECADKALAIKPWMEGGEHELYCMLKMSLPGDVRVRLRARNMKPGGAPFFGLLLSVAGSLKKEDGYFVEWRSWQVQMKKRNARVAGAEIRYGKPGANREWMNFMVQRVGAKITMFTEGREVLSWTDPYPWKDSHHDMFAIYLYYVHMEFDDLIIERNKLDPMRPRPDQPVFPENYLDGLRERIAPAAEGDRF